ncbi:MAG TPA: hypothetical protein PKN44_13075 [Bacteroidales bacterium]|nr:hypothetical protein [Bacteroidales bacterium]
MNKNRITSDQADIQYSNWISTIIDLIKPTNLYLFGGRGMAKSTDILAKRTIDIIYDMPRASFAFVSDTYVNLMTNIIPAVILGWESRQKFYENYHFVVDVPPPEKWPKPLIKTFAYKHTISTHNGCKFFLTSLDRPSANAGISVVHHFGDEAKYLMWDKLNKLFPTLRGDYALYGHSHYFMGQTFCSDMADPSVGESDWMLRMEKNMDKEQVMHILQAAIVLNEINIELYDAITRKEDPKRIDLIRRNQARWVDRLRKIRQDSTFFYIVSSFANADILTLKYFENLLASLTFEEFKTSVLSIKKTLEKGARFYGALSDRHFYADGYNYDYYDKYNIRDNISQTSAGLKYIQNDKILEAGFDAGNMMSLVIGQEQGNTYRVLKGIYTLTPEWIRELGDKFIHFFEPHKRKVLHLYHDRATNQYRKVGKDFASQLKHDIEFDRNEKRTGWSVQLMSVGVGNISHSDEFNLMNILMGEKDKRLPRLLIDKFECKELKSQLEITPVFKNSKGEIQKDKKGDKLLPSRLSMESTNFTDAFKYLLCRPRYLAIARQKHAITFSSLSI